MKIRKLISFFAAVLLIVNCFPAALADEEGSELEAVRVGYFELKNLMEGASENAEKSGFAYDYLQKIAGINNWTYEYVYGTFEELYAMLKKGEIDILPCTSYSDERSYEVRFTNLPIAKEKYYISVLGTEKLKQPEVYSFNGKVIGSTNGYFQNTVLKKWLFNNGLKMEVKGYDTSSEKWEGYRKGECDYILEIDNASTADVVPLKYIGESDSHIAVTEKRKDLREKLDSAREKLDDLHPFLISNLQQKYLANCIAGHILSEKENQWIASHNQLVIGGLKNDSPYTYDDSLGTEVSGLLPKLVQMMLNRMGIDLPVKWKLYESTQELHHALKSGEVDLITPEYHNFYNAEQNGLRLSEISVPVPMGLLLSGSLTDETTNLIAVRKTKPGIDYVMEVYPDSETVLCDTTEECIQKVLSGEARCAVAHTDSLQEAVRELSLDDSFMINTLSVTCDVCFAAAEQSGDLISIIDRGLHMVSSSEINQMLVESKNGIKIDKITLKEYVRENTASVAVVSGIIVFLFFFIIYFLYKAKKDAKRERDTLIREQKRREDFERTVASRTSELHERNKALVKTGEEIIEMMGNIVELRNQESGEHIQRVKTYTRILGESVMNTYPEYGLTLEDVVTITSASALHDVGKILIPDSVLLKPGKLTDEEYALMKTHCEKGCMVLARSPKTWTPRFLKTSTEICRHHHEKWDGKGYPDGLAGDDIPISAQIVSVADCFDALTTQRDYKPAFTAEKAFEMMTNGECGVFSPKVMNCLNKCREKFEMYASDPEATLAFSANASLITGSSKLKGIRFLLVDDDKQSRELNKGLLVDEGASVIEVEDGRAAFNIFVYDRNFDAILMDAEMPTISGVETTKLFRRMEEQRNDKITIITLVGEKSDKVIEDCLAAGADACLQKPLVIQELTMTLLSCMKHKTKNIEHTLKDTIEKANTDGLTKVKNMMAYTEAVADLTEKINRGEMPEFAVVVMDLNNLKSVNDNFGHETGDLFIKNCCKIFCEVFNHSAVYRIGGDEFAVILRDADYYNRERRFTALTNEMTAASKIKSFKKGRASFAAGMAVFDSSTDVSVTEVVKRADEAMYEFKRMFKQTGRIE